MTTKNNRTDEIETCPAQGLLKLLSGKWKPEIFRLAVEQPLRFSSLLRQIQGSNKQSLAVALRELEKVDLLEKIVIKQKPLHIEYNLTEKGKSLIPVFKQLEFLA
ncbi:MAG TPA: helix-turn-helix domain-containing protein [Crocinitomicaceae bacterium]|nr:helix-turn-helix domain-containing protein [Crocinitomicaceae bacterium]